MSIDLPAARSVTEDPTQEQLRSWVDEMPNATRTMYGNYSVQTRVTQCARSIAMTRSSG